jgi:hypothetical protein
MKSQQPLWCAKCHLEIVPDDLRTIYRLMDYHRHCFHLLIQEEAEQQNKTRSARASAGQKSG